MTNFKAVLLIIRAWIERGSASPLRATIRMPSTDPNIPGSETTVTTPRAGGEVVERWLQGVIDADQRDADAANSRANPPPK